MDDIRPSFSKLIDGIHAGVWIFCQVPNFSVGYANEGIHLIGKIRGISGHNLKAVLPCGAIFHAQIDEDVRRSLVNPLAHPGIHLFANRPKVP